MSCSWKEEQAYSFTEGSLDPESRQSFAVHLDRCPVCRERVADAGKLGSLLHAGITAVPAPPTLASRVAAVVVSQPDRRSSFAWFRRLGSPHLSPALAGLIVVLGLALATMLLAPGAVIAVVQRALVFIPGLGIKAVDQGNLVSTGPVSVREGGVTFTVEALLSQGDQTRVKFTLTGLPGGKEGWEKVAAETKPQAAEKAGQGRGKTESPGRSPYLRDERGQQYRVTSSFHGVGGSLEENRIEGELFFPPLPPELKSVDLVMPWDQLVPETVLPGAATKEWVVQIPLTPPTQSGLSQATPQGAAATVRGVTLRVAASAVEPDRTVVLLEGQAQGNARPLFVGKNGGDPTTEVGLRDAQGRSYRWISPQSQTILGDSPFQQTLYFAPVSPDTRQLTLTVKSLRIQEKGSAELSLSLADQQPGQLFALNRTVTLGDRKLLLKTARIAQEPDGRWLYVDVDLGPAVEGAALSSFRVEGGGASRMSSMGANNGEQMSRFGVLLAPGQDQVKLVLADPMLNLEGPWELTFALDTKQGERR